MKLLPLLAVCAGLALCPLRAQVLVNQSGYNTAESKRFTAPLAADGTPFSIVTDPAGTVVYSGTVNGGVGDFSEFRPAATGNFRAVIGTAPATETSYVFGIGPFWIERVSYRRMVQFFIDSRSGYGDATTWDVTAGKFSSGIAWRDSHQFSFELRTLIQWYAANPDAFGTDRMPVEGTYPGLRNTLPAGTPEIVRLIHWGVDIYLRGALNHTLIKEELAYFVYYYPLFQQWIPVSLYNEARDYLFTNWGNTAKDRWAWYDITHTGNLFQTYAAMGGTKGSFPPGHSIVPNLLMRDVALREGRSDSASYLTAARNQAQWIVNNLSASDPIVTKGQRMSEHILVPALAEFLLRDPQTPVTGIDAWLSAWTDTAIARSNNYWDFRKYSDTIWTPENVPGGHPWWNEPGNIAGFPASALAAATHIQDPAKVLRLRQIAVSQLDQVFGRNPHNRHFSFRAAQANFGFEGVEAGWFSQATGGLGDLKNVRGVLDASAKQLSFPYNPNVDPGYVEGWIAFNSAWNAAMVWAARDRSSIAFQQLNAGQAGGDGQVRIQLTAPLNFNRTAAETAVVRITSASGDQEPLVLTETGPDTSVFQGSIPLANGSTPISSDRKLDAPAGGTVTAAYAYDVFARSTTATAAAAPLVITTASLPAASVNAPYPSFALAAANASGSPTWSLVAGSLPAGITLLPTGALQGTPTASGIFTPTFRVTAGAQTAEKTLTLTSSAAPLQITTSSLGDAFTGAAFLQPLAASGGLGNVTWSVAAGSSLPAGLVLDPAGSITGTPSVAGTFSFSLTATDEAGASATSMFSLRVLTRSGVVFSDAFDSGAGAWFKAAPAAGDALVNSGGQLAWTESGNVMSEVIGRSFPQTTIAVGQKLRLTFDYRQSGTPTNTIVRAGLYHLSTPIVAANWAGGNAVGAWNGYGTLVRDANATGNYARVEASSATSATAGPSSGASGTYTDITSPANTTQFDINDTGAVTYQVVFEVTCTSATRMDTLFTMSSTSGNSTTTHFSVAGSTTTVNQTFDAVVFKQAGGSGLTAFYDNVKVEVIGGTPLEPSVFADWQQLTWPGITDPETTGPDRDPDGDGLNNLLEWALALDPKAAGSFRPLTTQDGAYILYTYTRRRIAGGEAAFHVEWSENLVDWFTDGIVAAPADPLDAATESILVTIPAGASGRTFVRTRVVR